MKLTKQAFIDQPVKAITLIGMSGVGKSHISGLLEEWGWRNYSCDYEIGTHYLKDALDQARAMSTQDIGALADYLGKLGNPKEGGFSLDLFRQRQKAYYDVEVQALYAFSDMCGQTEGHIVHDSTGSLCEIEDDSLLQKIGEQTLFVYLKAGPEAEKAVLKRAQDYPKPLFFPPSFLTEKLTQYLRDNNLSSVEDIHPDSFSRWVFPILFEARKPKYQRLADQYGVTIPAEMFKNLDSEQGFIDILSDHLALEAA